MRATLERMRIEGNISFIGAGSLAGALIRGLLSAGTYEANDIMATDLRADRLQELGQYHGIRTSKDNEQGASRAAIVVLSVKPQVLPSVLPAVASALAPDTLVISLAAGISTALVEAKLPHGTRVLRAMPNTPALVGSGATALALGTSSTDADLRQAEQIFQSVGVTVRVEEALMDAVTGLSGSGPAYILLVLEALMNAGVQAGLPPSVARTLSVQTVLGTARLLDQSDEHPAALRDMVASPAGTTMAGLRMLERGAVRSAFIEAVQCASQRANELGRRATISLGKG
ncbi:MAG: pyrroline-5-carboxylate reductase [Proteobacteria bacterium]|nr:pyrroline-5-carboxylate reductase [Pseudomonadota bacterium]